MGITELIHSVRGMTLLTVASRLTYEPSPLHTLCTYPPPALNPPTGGATCERIVFDVFGVAYWVDRVGTVPLHAGGGQQEAAGGQGQAGRVV